MRIPEISSQLVPNNEEAIREGRKAGQAEKRMKSVRQFVRSKTGQVMGVLSILGMIGLGVAGALGMKHYQDKQAAKINAEGNEKRQRENSFIAYCKLVIGAAHKQMIKEHEDFLDWTKDKIPWAKNTLYRGGITLDEDLNEIPPKNVTEKWINYLDSVPVSPEDIKKSRALIDEWEKRGPGLTSLEQVYQKAYQLFQEGKIDELNALLEQQWTDTSYPHK